MSRDKSLIKVITEAVQTGVGGNIHLNERSFLSQLLEPKIGESFSTEERNKGGNTKRHKTFVITRWLIRILSRLLTWLLWFFNAAGCFFVLLFRGINPLRLPWKIWKKIKCSPVINLAVVLIVLVFGIVFIVNMVTVGVKDIMFAPVNMSVNSQGVITLEQPCLESHSFFLMNASTFWWPTDISVLKGDIVTITVSGSMYSDVEEVYSAASSNRHLRYSRRFFAKKNENESLFDTIGNSICIEPKACFGALLCRVSNEQNDPSKTTDGQMHVIEYEKNRFKKRFEVDRSGVLYITFNDVLLSDSIVDKLRHSTDLSTVVMKEDLENTHYFNKYDSLSRIGQLEAGHREIWFNDNVGEYLVNIRVKKDICRSNVACYKKPIFYIYRGIENKRIYWVVGAIGLFLLLDYLVSYLIQRRRKVHLKQD